MYIVLLLPYKNEGSAFVGWHWVAPPSTQTQHSRARKLAKPRKARETLVSSVLGLLYYLALSRSLKNVFSFCWHLMVSLITVCDVTSLSNQALFPLCSVIFRCWSELSYFGLLGTRFEARNCICEPCPQKPYTDIVFVKPCSLGCQGGRVDEIKRLRRIWVFRFDSWSGGVTLWLQGSGFLLHCNINCPKLSIANIKCLKWCSVLNLIL
jgi:hypothetical protein